jgi:hypothetical protein
VDVLVGKLKGKYHLGNLAIDVNLILKQILNTWGVKGQTDANTGLRYSHTADFCKHDNEF